MAELKPAAIIKIGKSIWAADLVKGLMPFKKGGDCGVIVYFTTGGSEEYIYRASDGTDSMLDREYTAVLDTIAAWVEYRNRRPLEPA